MQSNRGMRSRAGWARGFAALWAVLALALAAGGGALAAPTETVLYSFAGGSDGASPTGLIADIGGNLYGTTAAGGASGFGVVFKLSPSGTETVLHSFTGGSNGGLPATGLIADSNGNLYGTTVRGGGTGCFGSGCGTVFKLSPGGMETVLYAFTGGINGAFPQGGLIADSSGNLYGTTEIGGGSGCGGFGCGVVFKLSPGGTFMVLYSFTGGIDGISPNGGLIADSSGNLYGTTQGGGASGQGMVFKVSPGGTETVLHSFTGGSDGGGPLAGLIADSSGNLYGTTAFGGELNCSSGCGVVFKLSPGGTYSVLYSFKGGSDGGLPGAGLIADSNGNLYGTTLIRGGNFGVVFKLAGTGFVPVIPFAAFGANLEIQFGPTPSHDRLQLRSSFTLGSASNGINPVTEPATLQIGAFTSLIPPGSFTGTGFGPFTFHGEIAGVTLEVRIELTGTKRYAFVAAAQNANLTGTVNPVPVILTIGDDKGTISDTASIK